MSRRNREGEGGERYGREERFRRRFDDDEPRYRREEAEDDRRWMYERGGDESLRRSRYGYRGDEYGAGDYPSSRDYGDYEYGREDFYERPTAGRESRGRFFERDEERDERSGYGRRRFDDAREDFRGRSYGRERGDEEWGGGSSRFGAARDYGHSENFPYRPDETDERARRRGGRAGDYVEGYRREASRDYEQEPAGRDARRYAERERGYGYDREDRDYDRRRREEPRREPRFTERGRAGAGGAERGWWERVSDEVASWFGDEEAERRRRVDMRQPRDREERGDEESRPHRGRGPRNYRRSDERIREDINDQLTDDFYLDASDIDVEVRDGEVVLSGTVPTRRAKRLAEDIAESVSGVTNVENRIRVRRESDESNRDASGLFSSTSGQQGMGGGEGVASGALLADEELTSTSGAATADTGLTGTPHAFDATAADASTGANDARGTGAAFGAGSLAPTGDASAANDSIMDASTDENSDRR